ncbi:MAG: ssDNA-binding protein [[Ruminococcus] torques]
MGNPIINQSEVYSGMYGRVNVTFFPYAFGGKKGWLWVLGRYRNLEDGETLSGRTCRLRHRRSEHHSRHQQYSRSRVNAATANDSQPQINPITGLPY